MRISIFGLGYVGAVSGACLAELGHEVIGVDVDPFKAETINKGESPIVEELINELIAAQVKAGRYRGTTNAAEAVANSEMSLVCVGTPSTASGGLETTYVERVSRGIGAALTGRGGYHVVVIRSTVLPGTVDEVVRPALEEASGLRAGVDFGLCFHPEFLREGTSVKDFREPPKIVIGADDTRAADVLKSIYADFSAPLFITSIRAAEMLKYADNAFHALKVVFGNEIGALCKALGIDSHEVMRIFCQDRKLNISPAYLMPGFAYGGSCLPKDLRALTHLARSRNVESPVLANIARSNEEHIGRVVDLVQSLGKREVALLGISFKPGTDDLRESPLVELVERLIGKGARVRIYDEYVLLARLRGGNKAYIEQKLPHISELLSEDLQDVIREAEIVIVGAPHAAFRGALEEQGQGKIVVDLVRLYDTPPANVRAYHGACW
ncbi:MAG: UDP-glucose/GDP-mannose dehydrogenase family protein [Candidatus Hydrogenedentota bacterium]